MSDKTINGIDVSEYFTNHYDNEGKLYAVEYKGNPLELQDVIKRLQEENNILKQTIKNKNFVAIVEENKELKEKIKSEKYIKENASQEATKYSMKCGEFRQALEEIRSYCDEQNLKADYTACYITNRIDEVLNDRD